MKNQKVEVRQKMNKFKFLKSWKHFKRGTYLEVPSEIYTGQVRLMMIWKELEQLIKRGIIIQEN
jgi:hypothetical protein